MVCNALDHIQEFNKEAEANNGDITLTIEFGSWMVEAVPAAPYDSPESSMVLCSFPKLISSRRAQVSKYFQERGITIMSLACTPTLGTRKEFTKCDPEDVVAKYDAGEDIQQFNKES